MKRGLFITAMLFWFVAVLFAHGNEKHVMGTVVKVNDSSITVKTQDGKSVDIALNSNTKFMKGDQPIQVKDIKEGDRVVVHAKPEGQKLTATTVMIGPMDMNHMKSGDMKGMDMGGDKSPRQGEDGYILLA